MKQPFLIILFGFFPFLVQAQSNNSVGRFGIELNSRVNNELSSIRLGPSLSYLKGKTQFNLGLGVAPFSSNGQQILSIDYRNKYFLNGTEGKYSLYLTNGLSYIRNEGDAFFNTKYNYLFFDVGYGFQVNPIGDFYLGTNVNAGVYTYHRNSENPIDEFATTQLFEEWRFQISFQFNVGYRF